MRLGLLDRSKASFKKAKDLLKGETSTSLPGNLKAFKDHVKFAKSTNHDTSKMFKVCT